MRVAKKLLITAAAIVLVGSLIWNSGGGSDFDEIAHAQTQVDVVLESKHIEINEVSLHVVMAGPENGKPVVLLHGFPQFWYLWKHHIAALAKKGFRVMAPDMRGYNRSSKPKGRNAYSYPNYAADIAALIESQGWQQANLVAHDIGGVVAWEAIFNHADKLSKVVIFSSGHPLAYRDAATESDVSWYRTFFRLPILPELVTRAGGLSLVSNTLTDTSRPGLFSDEEVAVYRAAWDRDHAFSSMLGAYRNDGLTLSAIPQDGIPEMPVLFVYGGKDQFIHRNVAEATRSYVGQDNVLIFPELSHWLLEEEPQLTSQLIIDFFQ